MLRTLPLFAVLLLAAPRAGADPIEAQRFFASAEEHYASGDFKTAIALYAAAYRVEPDPAFLYDLAQCYRREGDAAAAADLFTRYLHEATDAPNRQDVEAAIALLRAHAPESAPALELPSLEPAVQPASVPSPPARVTSRWWFWSAITGAAIVTAGGVAALAFDGPGVPHTALGHQDAFRP